MKPTIIIQARCNSKRLPKKVLRALLNQPVLYYLFKRLENLKTISNIVVATTDQEIDDSLVAYCQKQKVATFRGSEENVLERFYQCAKLFYSPVIVRLTADCPLVDPSLLDEMLHLFIQKMSLIDYLSNTLKRSFPKGLDIEIFSFKALEKAYLESYTSYQKEHVTPYIYQNPALFRLENFEDDDNYSQVNVSIDTLEDFEFVEKILQNSFPINPYFGVEEIKKQIQKLC